MFCLTDFFLSQDLNVWQCALHAFKEGKAELAVHVCTVLAEGRKPLCSLKLLTSYSAMK